jgi:hypothetical protein
MWQGSKLRVDTKKDTSRDEIELSLCAQHPGLDCIFIRLGPAPPTPPSLSSRLARTCVRTISRWEPM